MIEDRDERTELPGFSTPGHPREDNRLFAQVGGELDVVLCDNWPKGEPMPDYQIYLSTEYGRYIKLQLQARSGQVTSTMNKNDTETHTFRLPLDVAVVYPGTYWLRVLVNGKEVLKYSILVSNHPALL